MLDMVLAALLPAAGHGGPAMVLTSEAFDPGGAIPRVHTCDGSDTSPPLQWSGLPPATKSLALIVDDPDAPHGTWVHWIVYNLPPSATGLAAGGSLPAGALQGTNDWKRTGYGGPCPPSGRHRYSHRLYALDTLLPDLHAPTKARLEEAMQGHVLAQAELVATYQRQRP